MTYAGLDFGRRVHVVAVVQQDGSVLSVTRATDDADGHATILNVLTENDVYGVLIETANCAVVEYLVEHDVNVYTVNPIRAATHRRADQTSTAKDDRRDAVMLARLLMRQPDEWQRVSRKSEAYKSLERATTLHRQLIADRQRCAQRLCDHLARTGRANATGIIRLYTEKTLRDVLRDADHVTRVHVETIRHYNAQIASTTKEITRALDQHPDAALFRSIPGAGDVLAARLLVGMGEDRARYKSAEAFCAVAGCAPVTLESGQWRRVIRRRACNRNLSQDVQTLAWQLSMRASWARQYIAAKAERQTRFRVRLRSLGRRIARMLYAMWRERALYDEHRQATNVITNHDVTRADARTEVDSVRVKKLAAVQLVRERLLRGESWGEEAREVSPARAQETPKKDLTNSTPCDSLRPRSPP